MVPTAMRADDEHDRNGSREIQEADDDERHEPVGESAEEVRERELAAAILSLAAGHDPRGEDRREDGRREAAEQRDASERRIMIATKTTMIADPHPGRCGEEAPAFGPPGEPVARGNGRRGSRGAGGGEPKPEPEAESERGGIGSAMGAPRRMGVRSTLARRMAAPVVRAAIAAFGAAGVAFAALRPYY